MSYSIEEIAIGGALFGALWYFTGVPRENRNSTPSVDLEYDRKLRENRRNGIGDPRMINNLKIILLEKGIQPTLTEQPDPVKTLTELQLQLDRQVPPKPDGNITHPHMGYTSGQKVMDYVNLHKFRGTTLPKSGPDGD